MLFGLRTVAGEYLSHELYAGSNTDMAMQVAKLYSGSVQLPSKAPSAACLHACTADQLDGDKARGLLTRASRNYGTQIFSGYQQRLVPLRRQDA